MPVQFTTDGVPGYRRLALWQDIVCDVYVQLDCKPDLGSVFNGWVTRAPLGQATCSEVSSQTNVNRTAVTGDHRLREDLGIDSLSLIDVAVAAEDTFGIRIPGP